MTDLDEWIRGLCWQRDNASGTTLDSTEVEIFIDFLVELKAFRCNKKIDLI